MAKDWELAYKKKDTPWDKGMASPALKSWIEDKEISGNALVPGCGVGHDVRLLSRNKLSVTGIDISNTAIEIAKSFTNNNNVKYVNDNFFHYASRENNKFNWVFEHTFFCAIEKSLREDYVKGLRNLLEPKGQFLAIFFINSGCIYEGDSDDNGPPFKTCENTILNLFDPHFTIIESYIPKKHYQCRPHGSEILFHMCLK